MSNKTECPCCFGSGEEFQTGRKFKECSLCKGKGKVANALAEDYISSINVINIYDDDYYSDQC